LSFSNLRTLEKVSVTNLASRLQQLPLPVY
jgi:hypothetical protein